MVTHDTVSIRFRGETSSTKPEALIDRHREQLISRRNTALDDGIALANAHHTPQALGKFRSALELSELLDGEVSPQAAMAFGNLAWAHQRSGRPDALDKMVAYNTKALELFNQCREQSISFDHGRPAIILLGLGLLYTDEKRFEAAEHAFQEGLRWVRKSPQPEHRLLTAQLLTEYSGLALAQKQPNRAFTLAQQSQAIMAMLEPSELPNLNYSKRANFQHLASALLLQGRPALAQHAIEQAIHIQTNTLKTADHSLLRSLELYAVILEQQGRYDDARVVTEQAEALQATLTSEHENNEGQNEGDMAF